MSKSHRITGETTDDAFKVHQDPCFLWDSGALAGVDFWTFYIHKRYYGTLRERKKMIVAY